MKIKSIQFRFKPIILLQTTVNFILKFQLFFKYKSNIITYWAAFKHLKNLYLKFAFFHT